MRERRFFLIMTILISVLTVAGFGLNVALGRAVSDPPLIFHVHALAFIGWLVIAVAQGPLGYSITQSVIEGTADAERNMKALFPPMP